MSETKLKTAPQAKPAAQAPVSQPLAREHELSHDAPQLSNTPPLVMQRKLAVGRAGDACEREADAVARGANNIREKADTASAAPAPVAVGKALDTSGQPLEAGTRRRMERRLGHDFSKVRVHTGETAAASARAAGALAYTVGRDVVLGERAQMDSSPALMAHELAHVVQQEGTPGATLQRGLFESLARFFGGGTFTEEELRAYVESLRTNRAIEDAYDSDNKAREVVRRWQRGDAAFAVLDVSLRVLLIQEMASGYLSGDDQAGILALLEEAIASERETIIRDANVEGMRGRFDGERRERLTALMEETSEDVAIASLATEWTAEGVMEILNRQGDTDTVRTIVDRGLRILKFDRAFDTWQYDDGRVEEVEIPGLLGNTAVPEIRIRSNLTNERAATTIYHEAHHVTSAVTDYLEQEISVRVETEAFAIRHGLPETGRGYRTPEGTPNEPAIRTSVETSSHYNPKGRTRIGRRYEPVPQPKVTGWHVP